MTFYHLLTVVFVSRTALGVLFSGEQEESINQFVNNVLECRSLTGMSLGLVHGNESWTRGFGIANFSSQATSNNDTLFAIGSLSKAFTSSLMAIILDESKGRYNFDSKLNEILGEDFRLKGNFRTSEVTIKDILSHRTGLSGTNVGLFAGYSDSITREDLSRRLIYMPESKPFRDTFIYNNNLYMLAGYVTERLGGKSWEDLVKEKIFKALGMDSTRVFLNDKDFTQNNTAQPYTINSNGSVENSHSEIYRIHPAEPAGAILSSANDMVKWLQLMLNKGRLPDGKELINTTLQEEAFKSISVPPDKDNKRTRKRPQFPVDDILLGYGYGWFQSTYRGYIRQWHSGGVFSYISLLWVFPDLGIGLFASTNGPGNSSVGEGLNALFYYLSDIMMKEEPWINQTTACSFPSPWKTKRQSENKTINTASNISQSELERFTGIYGNYLYSDLEIKLNKTSRSLEFELGRMSGQMHPSEDIFVFRGELTGPYKFMNADSDLGLRFRRGDPIVELTLTFFGAEVEFSKLVRFDSLDTNSAVEKQSSDHSVLYLATVFIYLFFIS